MVLPRNVKAAPPLPANAQGLNVCSVPPIVHYRLLGLGGVEDQIVVPTPHREPLHFVPKGGLIPPGDEPHHRGVISKQQGLNTQPCGEPMLGLRAVEMWELTVTLWERSDRKPNIQRQMDG